MSIDPIEIHAFLIHPNSQSFSEMKGAANVLVMQSLSRVQLSVTSLQANKLKTDRK